MASPRDQQRLSLRMQCDGGGRRENYPSHPTGSPAIVIISQKDLLQPKTGEKLCRMSSFDISQLEPMSLYVVFTKKTSSGLMMGILLTKETLQSDKAEFVLAGNKRAVGGWMRINPVDIKVSEEPIRSFRLHTAVKLNETRLSEEHARSISIKIWPTTILGERDERLVDYLAAHDPMPQAAVDVHPSAPGPQP
ncbi:hypothetical protein DFH11DRAFT_1729128 [Phellopilus nigrolimitatus]|nr:hypothetical protein DFH11DRAFT_1729128 [Phellopilus nigrolimitatus]